MTHKSLEYAAACRIPQGIDPSNAVFLMVWCAILGGAAVAIVMWRTRP